ncbi:uncharacterized protein C6orf136 homolog [Protopterus annectens]|uniref:uncharacterized protein C6orf136 homolog n=1 Tax=Protopterus annectens TaxID=7888 RepID=UPI001CF9D3BC|nr:uncharacterized protein C6orf136 homolog [Protopterus annectens]XP_043940429.1 uncharacterized protein C6orf136 homolog [Protopterus annectens]
MAASMYRQSVALRGFAGSLNGCSAAVEGTFGRNTGHICKGKNGEAYYSQAKERSEACSSAVVHKITSAPWVNTPLSYISCLTSRHSDSCTSRTEVATAKKLAATYTPPQLESVDPQCRSHCSLQEVRMMNTDIQVQSIKYVPDEKISVHLLFSNLDQKKNTEVEISYSQLDNLEAVLVNHINKTSAVILKPDRSCRNVLTLSHIENIVSCVTPVDDHKDDTVLKNQKKIKRTSSSDWLTALELRNSALPCHTNGRVESCVWDMNGGHLDSFHSLFETELCRMPYHTDFYCSGSAPHLSDSLLFNASNTLKSSKGTKKNEPSMEEHLAVMYEKLRIELPNFFLKTHNYDIYSQDVEFINGFLHMKTRGRVMYQFALTLSRFLAWNYFIDIKMEVLKLTQHSENWTIQARWRITGLPFHVLLLRFYKRDRTELYRMYDAYSTFFLGSDGLIHCHKVDRMMPAQPPLKKVKTLLATAAIILGLREHRPALNLFFAQLALKSGQKTC